MKILDILHKFYGDFEFIKEKWNEKYEGILIKINKIFLIHLLHNKNYVKIFLIYNNKSLTFPI